MDLMSDLILNRVHHLPWNRVEYVFIRQEWVHSHEEFSTYAAVVALCVECPIYIQSEQNGTTSILGTDIRRGPLFAQVMHGP